VTSVRVSTDNFLSSVSVSDHMLPYRGEL
jgi:hypothetical protein